MAHFLYFVTALILSALASCLLAILGGWCYVRWKYRHLIRIASKLPSILPTLPILGSLHVMVFGLAYLSGRAKDEARDLLSRGITTATIWLGPFPLICVAGVDDIQKVLTSSKTTEKGDKMEVFKMVLENGLLSAPGHIWKLTRRAIDPLFHPRNLDQLLSKFNSNCEELLEHLAEHENQGEIDIFPLLLNHSLKNVCQLIFGPELDIDTKSEGFQRLIYGVKTVLEFFILKALMSKFVFEKICSKKIWEINTAWDKFTDSHIKTVRNNSKQIEINKSKRRKQDEPNTDGGEGTLNLITAYSVLQKSHPEFTDRELRSEIITLYCTGSDTMSTLLSTCLLLLAENPDIQERLYEEIISMVGPTGDVRADDHKKMPYLDQVYKETLRWSIIAPIITRKASEDVQLSSCTIPAGSSFLVAIAGPLQDSNIYPQPQKFDPGRFSSEHSEERHQYAYIPFSGGVRNCIGKNYSHILFKTTIIHVLRRFRVSTTVDSSKLKRKMIIFFVSTEGYKVSLRPRQIL